MNKEINIKTIGQLLDYVETEEKALKLIDYITSLEQRCEYLERSNNRREDEIMSLRDECVDGETYKYRNEKAIEYIKRQQSFEIYQHLKKIYDDIDSTEEIWEDYDFEDLLNILTDGDEE